MEQVLSDEYILVISGPHFTKLARLAHFMTLMHLTGLNLSHKFRMLDKINVFEHSRCLLIDTSLLILFQSLRI